MQNRINREGAIAAFLATLTPTLDKSVRDIFSDPDFALAKQCDEISLPNIDAIFAKADVLTDALGEPSAWIQIDLAILGANALVKRNVTTDATAE